MLYYAANYIVEVYLMNNFFSDYFDLLDKQTRSVANEQLLAFAEQIEKVNNNGGKVIVVGNGGSAAIASHVVVDFTKAAGIRATAFNDSSLLTCFGNDYGYENWVAKAIEFYADDKDMVILISSSGQSANITNGAKQAKAMSLPVVTLSGFKADNPLRQMGDINLYCENSQYNIVEIIHQTWILTVIDYLIAKNN